MLDELIDETIEERAEDVVALEIALLITDDLLLEELVAFELLTADVVEGIEHSLVPPGTLVPAPKVASLQTKLPLNILKVNLSARP
jgi:hypothetical protein